VILPIRAGYHPSRNIKAESGPEIGAERAKNGVSWSGALSGKSKWLGWNRAVSGKLNAQTGAKE